MCKGWKGHMWCSDWSGVGVVRETRAEGALALQLPGLPRSWDGWMDGFSLSSAQGIRKFLGSLGKVLRNMH